MKLTINITPKKQIDDNDNENENTNLDIIPQEEEGPDNWKLKVSFNKEEDPTLISLVEIGFMFRHRPSLMKTFVQEVEKEFGMDVKKALVLGILKASDVIEPVIIETLTAEVPMISPIVLGN